MKPVKAQADNFLRNELRKKAKERGLKVLPEQAQVNKPEAAKVKFKQKLKFKRAVVSKGEKK